jgi:hypothetical protein
LMPIQSLKIFAAPLLEPRWSTDADTREGVEQTKYIKEPEHDADDHQSVQDRLDTACHRDETIHQPKQDAHDDQGYENLHKRHSFLPFCLRCETRPSRAEGLRLALPGAENALNGLRSTKRRTTSQTSGAQDVLFDVLSAYCGSRYSSRRAWTGQHCSAFDAT